MAEMQTKVRLKVGHIEVDFEGDTEFLKSEVLDILEKISSIYRKTGPISTAPSSTVGGSMGTQHMAPQTTSSGEITGTVNTFAAKMGANNGPDLIMVAVVQQTFVEGKETVTRKEIADSMKTATSYFKPSYVSNLSNYLNKLIKDGKLIENKKDVYALHANARKDIEARLV